MPNLPEISACERVAALLDALPDGELDTADRAFLDRHTAACPACATELALAHDLARGLAALPQLRCPPAVSARVLRQAEEGAARKLPWRTKLRLAAERLPGALSDNLVLGGLLRPALAATAAALVATVLVITSAPPSPPQYSPAEVARAQAQLELAFAYLSRMGEETGSLVRQELVDQMISPAFQALNPAGAVPAGTVMEGRR